MLVRQVCTCAKPLQAERALQSVPCAAECAGGGVQSVCHWVHSLVRQWFISTALGVPVGAVDGATDGTAVGASVGATLGATLGHLCQVKQRRHQYFFQSLFPCRVARIGGFVTLINKLGKVRIFSQHIQLVQFILRAYLHLTPHDWFQETELADEQ
jgi:energy-converting hydrogenase Eha subunit A